MVSVTGSVQVAQFEQSITSFVPNESTQNLYFFTFTPKSYLCKGFFTEQHILCSF